MASFTNCSSIFTDAQNQLKCIPEHPLSGLFPGWCCCCPFEGEDAFLIIAVTKQETCFMSTGIRSIHCVTEFWGLYCGPSALVVGRGVRYFRTFPRDAPIFLFCRRVRNVPILHNDHIFSSRQDNPLFLVGAENCHHEKQRKTFRWIQVVNLDARLLKAF